MIHISTNDRDYPQVQIPVHFAVIEGGCDYVPGDINADGDVTMADITYGVQYLKGIGNPPPYRCWNEEANSWLYVAGDANGNCAFMGSDISYLVKYFRGQRSSPGWCPQTPPETATAATIKSRSNKVININKDDRK
jgi:hypothetical protein